MVTKKSPTKKPIAKSAAHSTHHASAALHYDKAKLLKGYQQTFSMFMKALMVGVGGAVLYFFGVITYLGLYGHSHGDSYIQEFGSRIQYDYKGTKLPMYENPALAQPAIAPTNTPATALAH